VFRFYVIGWRFCGLFLRWEILVILVMCSVMVDDGSVASVVVFEFDLWFFGCDVE